MSKDEDVKVLKIQTFVLKVNIHCDGCKQKVKKLLQKIDGVYTTVIDAEKGIVTVSGDVDGDTLIKKLSKAGKPAELISPKANAVNAGQLGNQFHKLQLNGGKGTGQKEVGKGGNGGNAPKGQPQPPSVTPLMKGFKDIAFPPLKDLKMPFGKGGNQKSVKFSVPEEGSEEDDEFDDDDDFDDDFDDLDCFDDDFDDHIKPPKSKPNFAPPPKKPAPKKAAADPPPIKHTPPPAQKNAPAGKAAAGKNNNGGGPKIPAGNQMTQLPPSMMMNMPRGGMQGNMMMNMAAPPGPVQGPPGFFPGGGAAITPEMFAAANPYQQQYLAAMMQQQRMMMNGQDRSLQQMPYYPRAAPPVSYMPPPPPEYTHFFSDENTNSCSVM